MGIPVGALAALLIAGGAAGLVWRFNATRRKLSLWRKGEVAEGRCTRAWTTTFHNSYGTAQLMPHHAIEFTTRDGRTVGFEESGGPTALREGGTTLVRYAPEAPEHATAFPPAVGLQYALLGLETYLCLMIGATGCALLVTYFHLL